MKGDWAPRAHRHSPDFSALCDFLSPELLWQREPSLHQPFPAEGQQAQSSFMHSLLPLRAGSVIYYHLHHGERFWQWEKAKPLHSLGHQRNHGRRGREAVLPVSNNTFLAVFRVGSRFIAQASCGIENCPHAMWGQRGMHAESGSSPLRRWQSRAVVWAHLVPVQCCRGLWSFWEQLEEEEKWSQMQSWKRR